MEKSLLVRDLQEEDIALLDSYWQSLTPEDLKRMSIDPEKLPKSSDFNSRVTKLLDTKLIDRLSDPLIWEVSGTAVGFTNLNNIQRPEQAEIHLHMIEKTLRGKGYGRRLFQMSVLKYFERHALNKIICQPSATNPGPNKLMAALGIPVSQTFRTIPSLICYEHEVNRYEFVLKNVKIG